MLIFSQIDRSPLIALLGRYGLELVEVTPGEPIPGSYWGESEAGLQGDRLFARADTPLHSILHEACHYICMGAERRATLDRDAGGDDPEENAVCYLQVLFGDELPGIGRERLMADMDAWGYSFRLGSTRAWFGSDAADARAWLLDRNLIDVCVDPAGRPTGKRVEHAQGRLKSAAVRRSDRSLRRARE